MNLKHFVSASIVAAMLATLMPAPAQAGEPSGATAPSSAATIRGAIDRAAIRTAAEESHPVLPPTAFHRSEDAASMQSGGGGGGHATAMIVWTLVGTAASLGTTYYVLKQLKKQTGQAAK